MWRIVTDRAEVIDILAQGGRLSYLGCLYKQTGEGLEDIGGICPYLFEVMRTAGVIKLSKRQIRSGLVERIWILA